MTMSIKLYQARDAFMDALMEHGDYIEFAIKLHDKYRDLMVDDAYPEAYWDEFNDQLDRLILDLIRGIKK